MKINKRQIVFLTLALVVCVAVYLNWRFLGQVDLEGENPMIETSQQESQNEKKLGEAELVETIAKDVDEYFEQCRLDKKQSRDEATELLKTVATSGESTEEAKDKANGDLIDLAEVADKEATIESLIKAKGFSECVVYITDETASVVVASKGLTPEEAAQINEIVISESGKAAASIKIVEIKTSES